MTNIICNECETVAHCMKNGCVPKQQALNKMADNARELGLDYEQPAPVAKPHEQEPVAVVKALPTGHGHRDMHYVECQHLPVGTKLYKSPPAQQEQGELRHLKGANQVMLEALKAILEDIDSDHGTGYEYAKARAAIVKGEKT